MERPSGLRIVAMPEPGKKAPAAQVVSAAKESETTDGGETKKELYKEKVHRFTPVYIPTPEEEAARKAESGSDDDDEKKADANRKRMGGLASMMAGKKAIASKSQALQLARAENELKSYAALSGAGRPIYSTIKKKKSYAGPSDTTLITEVKESKRVVHLHNGASIVDLAKKLKVKLKDLVDQCLDINLLVKGEDYVGIQLANEIAALYGYRVEDRAFNEDNIIGKKELTEEEKLQRPNRPPVVTIMGHVDHGKTTLLDYIRKAKVASGEAGGITQHIGAYSVDVNGKKISFLDTPGHAAFAAMRQRGATVTDIVILVVAADDGVMPQTRESIKFIQTAGVPMIVAVNKMDKEGINPDRIKQELMEFQITPEEWGGDTMFVPISGLTGLGVDNLLESILLLAEVQDFRADPKAPCEGIVIESKIEQGRGPVATILIQSGTLEKGDNIVVGEVCGRARSLTDHLGNQLKSAGPSTPIQILGLDSAPNPGDVLNFVKNEREAKRIADNRIEQRRLIENAPAKKKISLEDFFGQAPSEGQEQKVLNLIVRTDVQGSYEAIRHSIEPLTTSEVQVRVIGGGVGPSSDTDVQLGMSADTIIVGFNMRPVTSARRIAEERGVEIRTYSIIYELINDVKLAVEGMLAPEFIEQFVGRAEVRETFSVPKAGTIAGSVVIDGSIKTGTHIRLLRDGKIVHNGKLSSLKRFKDDVKEVKNGVECGIGLQDYNDIKVGDIFECYILEERKRKLDDVVEAQARAAQRENQQSL
jgi:translation initiation factor IF-2